MRIIVSLIVQFYLLLVSVSYTEAVNFPANLTRVNQQQGQGPADDSFSHILAKIEEGIKQNEGNSLAPYFAVQVYLKLQSEEEGYYSANQASIVLEQYLASRKVLNFHFTTTGEQDGSAYATGGGTIMFRGVADIIQVYVSFRFRDGQWLVTQFNIY